MEDRSRDDNFIWHPYEDLTRYEGEDEAPAVAPPLAKK